MDISLHPIYPFLNRNFHASLFRLFYKRQSSMKETVFDIEKIERLRLPMLESRDSWAFRFTRLQALEPPDTPDTLSQFSLQFSSRLSIVYVDFLTLWLDLADLTPNAL